MKGPQDCPVPAITRISAEPRGDGSLNQIRAGLRGFLSWRRPGLIESVTNFCFWSFSHFCSKLSLWNPYSNSLSFILLFILSFILLFPEFLRKNVWGCQSKENISLKRQEYIFPCPSLGYLSPEKAQEERLSAERNCPASRLTGPMNLQKDGGVQAVPLCDTVMYNKKYILGLHPYFRHWAPKTLGIS